MSSRLLFYSDAIPLNREAHRHDLVRTDAQRSGFASGSSGAAIMRWLICALRFVLGEVEGADHRVCSDAAFASREALALHGFLTFIRPSRKPSAPP